MRPISLLLTLFLSTLSFSQQGASSSEILLSMKKLKVLGSVLYVAAHPDDENTRLITYFSKDRLYRTGYLSVTRGDGGQNLIGDEQGVDLGLIRTQELLAARRIDGGEQFFTRAYDFGYSKNPEETFSKWNKKRILADVVWVIRKFRPDVIITRFPVTGEGGHGHHTASAILANEAFIAAADKNAFPEQLKYVDVWQPRRIVWNTFNFGGRDLTSNNQLRLDVGGYNSLLGRSYGEIAADSRSQHKSQGFGAASHRGEYFEFFKHSGGREAKKDLMEDVVQGWDRVVGGKAIASQIDKMIAAFDPAQPQRSVPALAAIHRSIKMLKDDFWKKEKLKETESLMLQCSGLFLDAYTTSQYATVADSLTINYQVVNRLGAKASLQQIHATGWPVFDSTNISLKTNALVSWRQTILLNDDSLPAQPYWLKNEKTEGSFVVKDQKKIGQPDVDPAISVKFKVLIAGIECDFYRPVRYRYTDPVKGEIYQPLVILPRLLVNNKKDLIISKSNDTVNTTLELRNTSRKQDINVLTMFTVPTIKNASMFGPSAFTLASGVSREVKVKIPAVYNGSYPIIIGAETNSGVAANGYPHDASSIREIGYDHIPLIHYFRETKINVRKVDLKIEGKRVGYIPGAGDKVAEAIQEMGYEVTILDEKELGRADLSQFDAIVAGIRAYNTNEWLPSFNNKLMAYVEGGGNYIVQYNTNSFAGPLRTRIGPYAFDISRTRVTDEKAEMKFVNPEHRVLNFPNKITTDDFKGWVQERSVYHAANWDKEKYETIFSMSDSGESDDEGSLIIAKHGSGNFVYTGLVFFRQLPNGVGYRLFANLIEL